MTPEEQAQLDNLIRAQGAATFSDYWNSASALVKSIYNVMTSGAETYGRLQMGQPLPTQTTTTQQPDINADAAKLAQQLISNAGLTDSPNITKNITYITAVIAQDLRNGLKEEDILKKGLLEYNKAASVYAQLAGSSGGGSGTDLEFVSPGVFKTKDGTYVNIENGIRFNPTTGEMSRLAQQAPVRTAAEEAASWASAGVNQAQAEALRSETERKNRIDEDLRAGRVYQVRPGIYAIPGGGVINERELDLAAERNNISRDDLKEKIRSNLASEAGRSEERAIQKAYNEAQVRLRQQELAQTGEYQRGQLQQGEQRLAIDRYVAEENARARAQQNALEKEKYIGDVLRKPSDFIARAITSGGGRLTEPVQTQADRINAINQAYAANPTTVAVPQTVNTGTNLATAPRLAYGSNGLSHYAGGSRFHGFVNDRMAVVGDPQRDGRPNPEVIYNPTGAPISVTPMRNFGMGSLATYANGTGSGTGTNSRMMVYGTGGAGTGGVTMPTRLMPHYATGTPDQEYIDYLRSADVPPYVIDQYVSSFNTAPAPSEPAPAPAPSSAPATNTSSTGTAGGHLAVVDGQAVWVPDKPASTTGTTTGTVTTKDGRTVNTSFIPAGYTANIQGIRPQDVSVGKLTGSVYDWYDPQTGSYGYLKDLPQFAGTGAAAGGGGGGGGGAYGAGRLGAAGGTAAGYTGNVGTTGIRAPIVAASPPVTQEQLIAQANRYMEQMPRLRALFGKTLPTKLTLASGSTSNPFEPGGITPYRTAFNMFSPQALGALTPAEKEALNSYLSLVYNTDLEEVLNVAKQMYGTPSGVVGGGRLVG